MSKNHTFLVQITTRRHIASVAPRPRQRSSSGPTKPIRRP